MENRWNELNKEMRWKVADYIAHENLPIVNENLSEIEFKETFYTKYIKRLFDIIISLLALIITLPINLIIAIVTFFDVGYPILFKQKRVGKNGKPFTIFKFRNMTNEKGPNGELLPASQRVTKWGKFVRKTSLDELLNFVSILKGDMTIISPRPLVQEYTHRLNKRHKGRLLVKPGLECPPKDLNDSRTWDSQFENDVWYVENMSFKTDLMLIKNLVLFAIDRKATKERSSVSGKGSFIGYDKSGKVINEYEVPKEIVEKIINETKKEK